jgi:hypothetical protein
MASEALKKRKFNDALDLFALAATIAYTYNFVPELSDVTIEEALQTIATANFEHFEVKGLENVVVLYDYFGLDNRGLTQQYLRALIQSKKRIIYILAHSNPKFYESDIYHELENYPDKEIYLIAEESYLGKVQEVISVLQKERPSKALMHLAPWDVCAFMIFYLSKGIVRYQINLTDHAYWLGVNITDINLDFRSYGANLSATKRKIGKDKIKVHPYYPILNQHDFEGWPVPAEQKKVILAGGSMYKILGEDLAFLHLIRSVLVKDKNLLFFFAGSGNAKPVNEFIKEHGLSDQFFLIGNRKDLTALLDHVDYFFTTFPLTGGLMTQIAAACAKPVFSFSYPEYKFNNLDDLFYKNVDIITYPTIEAFVEGFFKVYEDKSFLKEYGSKLQSGLISTEEFGRSLQEIFDGGNPYAYLIKDEEDLSPSLEIMSDLLIKSENEYNPQYDRIIINGLPIRLRKKLFPKYFAKEQRENLRSDKQRFLKNVIKLIINRK